MMVIGWLLIELRITWKAKRTGTNVQQLYLYYFMVGLKYVSHTYQPSMFLTYNRSLTLGDSGHFTINNNNLCWEEG